MRSTIFKYHRKQRTTCSIVIHVGLNRNTRFHKCNPVEIMSLSKVFWGWLIRVCWWAESHTVDSHAKWYGDVFITYYVLFFSQDMEVTISKKSPYHFSLKPCPCNTPWPQLPLFDCNSFWHAIQTAVWHVDLHYNQTTVIMPFEQVNWQQI